MTLAVLGRAHRQHQDWFDDNDAAISNLLAEKNRLHKVYVGRLRDDNRSRSLYSSGSAGSESGDQSRPRFCALSSRNHQSSSSSFSTSTSTSSSSSSIAPRLSLWCLPCPSTLHTILTQTITNTPTVDISGEDLSYTCPHCDRTFISHIGLFGHLVIHRTRTGKPASGAPAYIHCIRLHFTQCPRTFIHRMGLLGRIRIQESGIGRNFNPLNTSDIFTMLSPVLTPSALCLPPPALSHPVRPPHPIRSALLKPRLPAHPPLPLP
nr:unnamed protein product [Spirometra erinaceieuropaei]